MKKSLRDAWVAALRSGKFPQGKNNLLGGGAYCCLGVLCRVAGLRIPRDVGNLDDAPRLKKLRDAQGLGTMDFPDGDSFQSRLAEMNDRGGKTFSEIADWIEANIPVTP